MELIRIRATSQLLAHIDLDVGPQSGGVIDLPPRVYRVEPGDAVKLEFSLGALNDEVTCRARVLAVAQVEGGRRVRVEVAAAHRRRLEYVRSVLAEEREPGARRHRRVRFRTPVAIEIEGEQRSSYTGDIGCGGAFIVSDEAPAIDSEVRVALQLEASREIRTTGRVAWSGAVGDEQGFGVEFSLPSGDDLDCIRDIVLESPL